MNQHFSNDNGNGDWSHIEIHFGIITSAPTIETSEGVRRFPEHIGEKRFFIEAIEPEGGRLCLNSCDQYEDAIRLAEQARVDLEIDDPIRDCVVGDH